MSKECDQFKDRRDKASGRFTNAQTQESPIKLIAQGKDGNPVGYRTIPGKRKITHAIAIDHETEATVLKRNRDTKAKDTALLSSILKAQAETPEVISAGRAIDNTVAVYPPRYLDLHIQPVYASPERFDEAIHAYREQLKAEETAVKDRIKAAELSMEAVENGTYTFQRARVLRWVTSFQAARKQISGLIGRDHANLQRLYIAPVIEGTAED